MSTMAADRSFETDDTDMPDGLEPDEDQEPADETPDDTGSGDRPDRNPGNTGDEYIVGPDGTTYVVKPGDMLMKIAKNFYGDESKYVLIMEANNIQDPDKIFVGQELKIPPIRDTWTVRMTGGKCRLFLFSSTGRFIRQPCRSGNNIYFYLHFHARVYNNIGQRKSKSAPEGGSMKYKDYYQVLGVDKRIGR